jgi:hypothetical protein
LRKTPVRLPPFLILLSFYDSDPLGAAIPYKRDDKDANSRKKILAGSADKSGLGIENLAEFFFVNK